MLAFARIADIVARYEGHRAGARSSGPGAARVDAELDRIADELGDLPGAVVDHGRLRSMLHHLATTLAVALCLAGADPDRRQEPVLTRCAPGRCPYMASVATAQRLEQRMDRRASRMSGHVVIGALGTVGYRGERLLGWLSVPTVVVELDHSSQL